MGETIREILNAIESWFFGPSDYPENYVPIAF